MATSKINETLLYPPSFTNYRYKLKVNIHQSLTFAYDTISKHSASLPIHKRNSHNNYYLSTATSNSVHKLQDAVEKFHRKVNILPLEELLPWYL